jgi:hypothetical protein
MSKLRPRSREVSGNSYNINQSAAKQTPRRRPPFPSLKMNQTFQIQQPTNTIPKMTHVALALVPRISYASFVQPALRAGAAPHVWRPIAAGVTDPKPIK